jgi:hypothetical protein
VQVLEYVGMIAAPTTLATALAYWLGFELMDARSAYFDLGVGTLGLSTTDYLIRGAEAGVVPLFVLFTAMLMGAGVHGLVSVAVARIADATRLRRVAVGVLSVGTIAFAIGFVGLFTPLPAPFDWYELRPVLLIAGPLTAFEGTRLLCAATGARPYRTAVVAIGGIVVLGCFWGVSIYADALGRGRALALGENVDRLLPAVRVYSERSLGIDPDVAVRERLPDADARYAYRYSGLRLLVRSDGKYYLIPDGWTRASGRVVVLLDAADIRVEFSRRAP